MMLNILFFSLLWVSFVHSLFKFLRWKWRSMVCKLFFKIIYLFILFLAVLGIRCYTWTFSSCGKRGLFFFTAVHGLLVMASLVSEHGLYMCSRHVDFSSHSTQAYLLCVMWDFSGSEIGPMFPCIGRWISHHGTTRKTQFIIIFFFSNMEI